MMTSNDDKQKGDVKLILIEMIHKIMFMILLVRLLS